MGGGGASREGAEKVLVMLKGGGGHKYSFEVVLTQALDVLAISKGRGSITPGDNYPKIRIMGLLSLGVVVLQIGVIAPGVIVLQG